MLQGTAMAAPLGVSSTTQQSSYPAVLLHAPYILFQECMSSQFSLARGFWLPARPSQTLEFSLLWEILRFQTFNIVTAQSRFVSMALCALASEITIPAEILLYYNKLHNTGFTNIVKSQPPLIQLC